MISHFHVSDKNIVGLLLLLRSKGEITTAGMTEINQYEKVRDTAIQLRLAGLLSSETLPDGRNKTIWKLTPEGHRVANCLNDAEQGLNIALGTRKGL